MNLVFQRCRRLHRVTGYYVVPCHSVRSGASSLYQARLLRCARLGHNLQQGTSGHHWQRHLGKWSSIDHCLFHVRMGPSLKTVRMQHPLGLWPVSSPFGLCTYGLIWRRPRVHRLPSLSSGIVRTRRTGGYGVRRVARHVAVTRKAARCRSGSEVERRTAAHHRFHRLAESMRFRVAFALKKRVRP